MVPYIGDFAEDATIYHYFNTFSSNDPSASVTVTDLADADIFVYKDGSITDIVTDGATVVIDFDGRTGVHKITIDTSVHADYAIGSDYVVVVNGTTVDAGTVTAALFTFSIENRYNAAADDLANGTDGLGAIKADTAAILLDTDVIDDGTSGLVKIAQDVAAILVDTATIDTAGEIAAAVWNADATTYQGAGSFGLAIGDPAADGAGGIYKGVVTDAAGLNVAVDVVALKAETALIVADTNELQVDDYPTTIAALQTDLDTLTAGVTLTAASVDLIWDETMAGHVTADTAGLVMNEWQDAGRLDAILDTIAVDVAGIDGAAMRGTDSAALATALATAQLDLDTLTGTDGATLATAQALYAPAKAGDAMTLTAAGVDLIWDETMAGHVTADTSGLVMNEWQDAGRLDAILDVIAADVVNVDGYNLATQIGTAGAGLTNITLANDLSATMKTSVQTAVDAAIDTAISELGVAAPTATPNLRTGLMLLYMALRNKLDVQTSGTDALEIHNAAGTQITQKLITDAGGDYSEAQMG